MNFEPLNAWIKNLPRPLIIAGPCSAESFEQVMTTAKALAKIPSVRIFRAGLWKPRTRPNHFEGHGTQALEWIAKAGKETGLLTATEVANQSHVENALKYGINVLWIGARTTASPFAVQEIADAAKGSNVPILIKNPINPDMASWVGAIERLQNSGHTKLVAVHRGFSHLGGIQFRNDPLWKMAIDLKGRFPELPLICDPSHIAGKREYISTICQKALDLDFDGLMIESHPDPDQALSDSAQQLTPQDLQKILEELDYKQEIKAGIPDFELELLQLRAQIDRIDRDILESLAQRMSIVKKIGAIKRQQGITILQKSRMVELMKARLTHAKQLGLSASLAEDIFRAIHTESVKYQTEDKEK